MSFSLLIIILIVFLIRNMVVTKSIIEIPKRTKISEKIIIRKILIMILKKVKKEAGNRILISTLV